MDRWIGAVANRRGDRHLGVDLAVLAEQELMPRRVRVHVGRGDGGLLAEQQRRAAVIEFNDINDLAAAFDGDRLGPDRGVDEPSHAAVGLEDGGTVALVFVFRADPDVFVLAVGVEDLKEEVGRVIPM